MGLGYIPRLGCLLAFIACFVGNEAWAQSYPAKPIRVVDAYPPGGSTDVVARMIGQKFLESQKQPWVVDNRPGAQGIIGTDFVAKAPGDGYTLLMFTGSHTIHPSIYKNLPYDFLRAFVPITHTSNTTNVLVVHPSVPVKSVRELVALAKAKPDRLNFSSAGTGSTTHMATELLKSMTGITMTHIPYKGSAPAVLDAVAGHVDLAFAPMPVAAPHIRSGKLRALGVASAKRAIAIPELPTIAEAGVPGYEATNSVGVLAPAGTPRDVVSFLNQEIVRILSLNDVRERLVSLGAEPVGSTPEQFGEFMRTEIAKWSRVVRDARVPLQAW